MQGEVQVKDEIKIIGEVVVRTWRNGKLVQEVRGHNIFCIRGKKLLLDFLQGNSVTGAEYEAIGTGTSTPAETDLQLDNEVGRQPITQFVRSDDKTLYCNTFFNADYPSGSYNITEVGLFGNGASSDINSGYLISRVKLSSPVYKDNTLTLTVEHKLYFS